MAKRRLPPYQILEDLYVRQGLSFGEIGARYKVKKGVVWNCMSREAIRTGRPWPLEAAQTRNYGGSRGLVARYQATSNELVAGEINDLRAQGVKLKEIADRAGVNATLVWRHASRYRQMIAKSTADRIMKAVIEIEKERAA